MPQKNTVTETVTMIIYKKRTLLLTNNVNLCNKTILYAICIIDIDIWLKTNKGYQATKSNKNFFP